MKNFMVANRSKHKRYDFEKIELLIKAQIENSLDLGWEIKDIILLANFNYEFLGVKTLKAKLNKNCLTGSKVFGIKYLFDNKLISDDEIIWAHDLDAWQNVWFECPEIKDVGITCYSTSKFNGGSIFWNKKAKDIVDAIVDIINNDNEKKEEPTLNDVLKSKKYKDRVEIINRSFNVGCSGYVVRWLDSIKPLKVCHFHPYNNIAWETHALDRNGLDVKGITPRLEKIIRKYYPNLATKLSRKGEKAQKERKDRRLAGLPSKPRKGEK